MIDHDEKAKFSLAFAEGYLQATNELQFQVAGFHGDRLMVSLASETVSPQFLFLARTLMRAMGVDNATVTGSGRAAKHEKGSAQVAAETVEDLEKLPGVFESVFAMCFSKDKSTLAIAKAVRDESGKFVKLVDRALDHDGAGPILQDLNFWDPPAPGLPNPPYPSLPERAMLQIRMLKHGIAIFFPEDGNPLDDLLGKDGGPTPPEYGNLPVC